MSFSFGFSGDDIEDDDVPTELAAKLESTNITAPPPRTAPSLLKPKRHALADLLQSLPSQVSYNYLDVPVQTASYREDAEAQPHDIVPGTRVPRREIYDIRQQLMAEVDLDDNSATAAATDNLLEGLATGDLSTGVYEGGFKTWECAVDLAGFVSSHPDGMDGVSEWHVVELGAGSAIPSLVLLQKLLRDRKLRGEASEAVKQRAKVRFTLCDYNEDVLRLCTAVNVFLTILRGSANATMGDGDRIDDEERSTDEGHIEIEEELTRTALGLLSDANIEVEFISGAWGDEFLSLLCQQQQSEEAATDTMQDLSRTLVLASETIYSPDSLEPFSRLLVNIIENEQRNKTRTTEAFVAAKKVYFGVGGGVAEFEEEMRKLGATTRTVLDVKGAGVGRVVLGVSAS